jgi:hypothetical protein
MEERRKADDRFTWRVLGVMVFLVVWTLLLYRFNWPTYIYALTAGGAVLYLLAYIYPKDFTLLAVYVSGGAFGLWMLTKAALVTPATRIAAYVLFVAALALSALLFWFLRGHRGTVGAGRVKLALMPPKARYRYLFVAAGMLAVSFAVSAAFGSTAAWCSMIAMFSYLFVMAVYYTVRLI